MSPSYHPIDLLRADARDHIEDRNRHVSLWLAIIQGKQPEQLVQEFKALVDLIPFWTQLHYDICAYVGAAGYGQLLEETFEKAYARELDDFRVAYGLGLVLQTLNKHERAAQIYQAAIIKKPEFAPFHYNLAVAYMTKDMLDEEEEAAKEAVRCSDFFAEPHYLLGMLALQRGNMFEAEVWLHEFVKLAGPYLERYRQSAQGTLAVIRRA